MSDHLESLTSSLEVTEATEPDNSALEAVPPCPRPGLVLAHCRQALQTTDRASATEPFTVGRSSASTWKVPDTLLSGTHFEVHKAETAGRLVIEDLRSRNGTFVDGERLCGPEEVGDGSIVRAGGCLFVVDRDLCRLALPGATRCPGMAGPFHAPRIAEELGLASCAARPVLLDGESGTGKELAAQAFHEACVSEGHNGPFVVHNAACFGAEQDAVAALFGVVRGAFTDVADRVGLLERADGGTLYLDELHNLPLRVQRSLLRFVEDGLASPLGRDDARRLDVRLVLGTNVGADRGVEAGLLAPDLLARSRRVTLPSLRTRRGDIPDIFLSLLGEQLGDDDAAPVIKSLNARHFEKLCLADHSLDNVRSLQRAVETIAARIERGEAVEAVLAETFAGFGRDGDADAGVSGGAKEAASSLYERNRDRIVAAYRACDGNVTALASALEAEGLSVNRKWLAHYLEKWGERRRPKATRGR